MNHWKDYYTTDEHIQEALIAAYDPLHWPDWGLGQYNALNIDGELWASNFWVGGATKTDMQNWHMLFNYEANENNTLGSLWTVDYSGIKRCNDFGAGGVSVAIGELTDGLSINLDLVPKKYAGLDGTELAIY